MKKKLKDICTTVSRCLLLNKLYDNNGPYPLYGAKGIMKYIDFYDYKNDYLSVIKWGAGVGRITYHPGHSSILGTMQGLMPKKDIDINWFYFCLKSMHLEKHATITTVPNLYFKDYGENIIDVPTIEKQKEISSHLLLITNLISKCEKELTLLDELLQTRFVEIFGDIEKNDHNYKIVKMGEVCEIGSSHRVFTNEFVDSGIPFYRGTEIGELSLGKKPQDVFYISKEHYKKLASDDTKPRIGDILIPSICNKGQVWMVNNSDPFYYKDGRVLSIRPNKQFINSKYFEMYFRLKSLIEYPKLQGATFAEFKIFILKNLDIILPPLSLQDNFVKFISGVEKTRNAIRSRLTILQEVLDKKMNVYFGGNE